MIKALIGYGAIGSHLSAQRLQAHIIIERDRVSGHGWIEMYVPGVNPCFVPHIMKLALF